MLQAGFCSDTRRAHAVRDYFDTRDVSPSKLAINDEQIPSRSHRNCVAVQEGRGVEMEPEEFRRFMSTAWNLVKNGPSTRWATQECACAIISYEYIDGWTLSFINNE